MSTLITTTAQIGTIKDAGGNNTAMTIDSAGRVTLPQRVAFQGKKGDTGTLSANSSSNITFNLTDLAHAAWNGTTFTAPVAGLYRLFINGHKQTADTNPMELAIYVNGSAIETGYVLGNTNVRPRVSVDSLTVLAVNDAVTFRILQGDVYAGSSGAVSSNLMCSGYLIG